MIISRLFVILIVSITSLQAGSHHLFRYDPTEPEGFQNLRSTKELTRSGKDKKYNKGGLAVLNASASGQLDEAEFKTLKKRLKLSMPLLVIDLRQETHGMINGVSVYVKSQEAFAADAIKKLEESIFTESSKGSSVTIHQREPKKIIRDVVKSIKTEEETCLMHGLQYLRIPLVDHKVPTTEQIDLFVDLVDQLQDTWLHFHCRKGLGRSTTFMTLYDILKNGHVVTLDEILHRQRAMGGANLTHEKAYGEHHRLLKEFYAFAKDHRAGHAPRWSKWKKKRH